ncbi:MAG TPA: YciI family protein [Actinomycetes bacterium]|nr:YciI family protein [Actinomycetes bacterium]
MAQYLYLIYGDETGAADMTPEDWQLMMKAHGAFAEQVTKLGGTIVDGQALALSNTATTVRRGSAGKHAVTDGPFIETKEALGGYYLIEAKDLDQAIAFAKLVPTEGGVEVRPTVDTSGG